MSEDWADADDRPALEPAIAAAHAAAVAAGDDGYIDAASGYFVFTAAYLAARGTCCDSGCRHCPYGTKRRTADA